MYGGHDASWYRGHLSFSLRGIAMKTETARSLTLVYQRRGKFWYPKSDRDFELLKELGVSIKFCLADYLPLLEVMLSAKGVKLVREDFDELEAKALASLEKKWLGTFGRAGKSSFWLACPKTDENLLLMKSVKRALQAFYMGHGFKVSYVIKRQAKSVRVTFTSEPDSKVFVLTDDER